MDRLNLVWNFKFKTLWTNLTSSFWTFFHMLLLSFNGKSSIHALRCRSITIFVKHFWQVFFWMILCIETKIWRSCIFDIFFATEAILLSTQAKPKTALESGSRPRLQLFMFSILWHCTILICICSLFSIIKIDFVTLTFLFCKNIWRWMTAAT